MAYQNKYKKTSTKKKDQVCGQRFSTKISFYLRVNTRQYSVVMPPADDWIYSSAESTT